MQSSSAKTSFVRYELSSPSNMEIIKVYNEMVASGSLKPHPEFLKLTGRGSAQSVRYCLCDRYY